MRSIDLAAAQFTVQELMSADLWSHSDHTRTDPCPATPCYHPSLRSIDLAAAQFTEQQLMSAAPWFHSDHLFAPPPDEAVAAAAAAARGGEAGGTASSAAAEAAFGAAPDDGLCDWCGAARGAGGEAGCAACGAARYCGAACAAAAAPLHARNCVRLRLLRAPGVALAAPGDPERPVLDYGDAPPAAA